MVDVLLLDVEVAVLAAVALGSDAPDDELGVGAEGHLLVVLQDEHVALH